MLNLPFYGNKKLRLAFEMGVMLADVAKKENVEVTPELMKRAEEVIVSEFRTQTPTKLALDVIPNLLAIFQTRMDV